MNFSCLKTGMWKGLDQIVRRSRRAMRAVQRVDRTACPRAAGTDEIDDTGLTGATARKYCWVMGYDEHGAGPTRRKLLKLALAAVTTSMVVQNSARSASASNGIDQAILDFTGGIIPGEGEVILDAPEIADNGGSVQVRIAAAGARKIALFSEGNPNPGVVVFTFGKNAVPAATTRIRLAGSQNLVAVAEMTDGTFIHATRPITVTVGGCG